MIDLSIIIPVYNKSKLLNRCLDSVFHQTTHYSYEVILVDDGSTDDSVELIKARKEANIILFEQQNAGPSVARNKGVELAHGKYCAYLDADDYWMDGFIEKTVSFLEEHEECVAVTVGQLHKTISGDLYNPKDWLCLKNSFVISDFFSAWVNNQFVGTCSTTMRTNSIKVIGGQRADLFANEDFEFWFCLSTLGKWGFIPQVLYVSDGVEYSTCTWVEKNERRWKTAGSVENWECRLNTLILKDGKNKNYLKACGMVAWGIIYCQMVSGRTSQSWHQCRKYGKYFANRKIAKIMNLAKQCYLTWYVLCKIVEYREYHR